MNICSKKSVNRACIDSCVQRTRPTWSVRLSWERSECECYENTASMGIGFMGTGHLIGMLSHTDKAKHRQIMRARSDEYVSGTILRRYDNWTHPREHLYIRSEKLKPLANVVLQRHGCSGHDMQLRARSYSFLVRGMFGRVAVQQ
jgi:hypothetical protein